VNTEPTSESSAAPVRVAFQGELGAYSDEALRRFFGEAAEPVPCRDFDGVGERVTAGTADYGLLPIENSLAGSVVGSYDVLAARDLRVFGEIVSPIHHCLLGLPGAGRDGLRRVLSHPVALAQCTRFFRDHAAVDAVSYYDTAGAARAVAMQADPGVGAIASRLSAARYGLEVLASDIEDRPDNQTRFLVVARPGAAPVHERFRRPAPEADTRTALLAETANEPGALVRILLPFAERGVNLVKLESRPGSEPWTYRFFVELEGGAGAGRVAEALEEARRSATALRVLGSYARWRAEERR
jgi:prephenate dehydratase